MKEPRVLGDLAHGLRQSVRRPPTTTTRSTRTGPPPPAATPAENLELLSVIDPTGYRAACAFLKWGTEERWQLLSRQEQIAAVEEMERRREAVKNRPGSHLL